MPWEIVKDSRCPASKPYGVVGGSSGDKLAGCHPSQDAAKEQQKALYAAENRVDTVMFSTPPSVSG